MAACISRCPPFFGIVISMTFVATLRIYGIASRNFILVSLWVCISLWCSFIYITFIVTVQLYESESTANDLLRKELQQLKQELNKTKSEVEVARAVAVANETSSRRLDAAIAVGICFIYIHAGMCFKSRSSAVPGFQQ